MTTEGKESEETRVRTSALTCLFCDRSRNVDEPSKTAEKSQEKPVQDVAADSFWICDVCQSCEKERTEALEASLLLNGSKKEKPESEAVLENSDDTHSCACQACVERRELEVEQEKELHDLQKCWVQLRHAVRSMYRDGLDKEMVTSKGKHYDQEKLKTLVHQLCERDPHQLYQRLESQGREYVMEMKVNLLQILISPEKVGLRSASPKPSDKGGASVSLEQTKCFLKSALDNFSAFQETVRNMQTFMQELDRVHLEKFGITWKVINHHLFDSVVYQDGLIQNSLPAMAEQLGVHLVYPEGEDSETAASRAQDSARALPPAAIELAQSFRALDRLMRTSREIWEKANQRMEEFTKKQMRLYKATLKAKQRMLKEDLEFFKQQRRILENYVAKSKAPDSKDNQTKLSNEDDLAAFAETLRALLAGGRPNRQHATSPTKCARCQQRHCPCDECTISHVITCGLVSEEDKELELPPSILDELPDFSDFAIDESPFSTGDNSSESDDDPEYGSEDEESPTHTAASMDTAGHVLCKRTTIICSDGHKGIKTKSKYSTAVIPSTLYTLHHQRNAPQPTDVEQHFEHAYGDWEVSWEPSHRIFPGLDAACHLSEQRGGSSERCNKTQPQSKDKDKDNNAYRQRTMSLPTDSKKNKAKEAAMASKLETKGKVKERSALDISLDKLPPELIKIMKAVTMSENLKEETLAKALTVAAARRGLVAAPPGDSYYNWKDLEKLDWKDLNIDSEALRRFYEQHNHEVKVVGEPKPPKPKNEQEKKEQTSVATQVEMAAAEPEDELEDSWSDDRSSESQRDGKHCDCCYCEMFGHGGVDGKGPCGRVEYPQIRERLRLKLKKKGEESSEAAVRLMESSERIEGHRGWASVDELLEYINGPKHMTREQIEEQHSSSKAAKRQRHKQKKQEEKAKKDKRRENNNNSEHRDKNKEKKPKSELSPNSPTKKAKKRMNGTSAPADEHRCARSKSGGLDEVFKPKEDLDNLDEADRDVEKFKQFVLESAPLENRPKVKLNLSSLLKGGKKTAVN